MFKVWHKRLEKFISSGGGLSYTGKTWATLKDLRCSFTNTEGRWDLSELQIVEYAVFEKERSSFEDLA